MPNRIAAVLFVALLALMVVPITSCGGSGTVSPPAFNVAGNWMLTVTAGGTATSGPGVITQSGLPVSFQTTSGAGVGDTLVFPSISGPSFAGPATLYETTGHGGLSQSQSVQGNVSSNSSVTGNFANGSTLVMASNSPLIGSVVTLPANMNGEVEGWYANIWQINISPSGQNHSMTITGSAPGLCALSGTLTQEGNLNVFDVSITYTGSCPPGPIPRTGVGFESNSDYFQLNGGAAGTYFYFASTTYGNVLELFP